VITSDDITLELARTMRELECRALKKLAALQLGEAFIGLDGGRAS
jgi:hypothetical protein